MKKLLLVAAALAAFSQTAQSQEILYGFKGGVNFANVGGDANGDMLTAFHFGEVNEVGISEQFSMQIEVLASFQGYKVQDQKTSLIYLSVPLMAKYFLSDERGFSIEAGPQLGYLASVRLSNNDTSASADELYNKFDYGVAGGVAYDMESGLFFQARYYLGLADIFKGEPDYEGYVNPFPDVKMNNSLITLSIGYKFMD